ncbi:MAG: purine-binding chemotaxis protein CheW [Spirochaetes bacterium]|nr:purine-binding chemotaxis protein CheW [Spirochaetota bacterium]
MTVNELLNKENDDNTEVKNNENDEASDGKIVQLVTFTLDDVEYGVDILSVHEILRYPEITRLPNTPKFIKGVINLRGNVLPVVDVRNRFGFKEGVVTDLTRVIVIEAGERQIGLLVDNVSQVIRINDSNIDPPSILIEGVSEAFITGIARLKGRLIVILSVENVVFSDEEIAEKQKISMSA